MGGDATERLERVGAALLFVALLPLVLVAAAYEGAVLGAAEEESGDGFSA